MNDIFFKVISYPSKQYTHQVSNKWETIERQISEYHAWWLVSKYESQRLHKLINTRTHTFLIYLNKIEHSFKTERHSFQMTDYSKLSFSSNQINEIYPEAAFSRSFKTRNNNKNFSQNYYTEILAKKKIQKIPLLRKE